MVFVLSTELRILQIIFRNWDGSHIHAQHKWSDFNRADRCPCRVVETLAPRTVFLMFLCNIPTEKSWWVYLFRYFWWWHLAALMMWSFALKWRRHHEGRREFAFHVFSALLDSEYHTFIPIGFKDACFQSLYLDIFCCWGRKTAVL